MASGIGRKSFIGVVAGRSEYRQPLDHSRRQTAAWVYFDLYKQISSPIPPPEYIPIYINGIDATSICDDTVQINVNFVVVPLDKADVAKLQWVQLSGPAVVNIATPNQKSTFITLHPTIKNDIVMRCYIDKDLSTEIYTDVNVYRTPTDKIVTGSVTNSEINGHYFPLSSMRDDRFKVTDSRVELSPVDNLGNIIREIKWVDSVWFSLRWNSLSKFEAKTFGYEKIADHVYAQGNNIPVASFTNDETSFVFSDNRKYYIVSEFVSKKLGQSDKNVKFSNRKLFGKKQDYTLTNDREREIVTDGIVTGSRNDSVINSIVITKTFPAIIKVNDTIITGSNNSSVINSLSINRVEGVAKTYDDNYFISGSNTQSYINTLIVTRSEGGSIGG